MHQLGVGVLECWRRGWDSNPERLLETRNLLISRSDQTLEPLVPLESGTKKVQNASTANGKIGTAEMYVSDGARGPDRTTRALCL